MLTELQEKQAILPSGAEVHYYVGGKETGTPVVMLHGGGTDHAMLSWRESLPKLIEAGYRVYAPSYPGYGESPKHEQPATTKNLINYLGELIEIWEIDKASLVGISMGGALSLGYTLQNPGRVQSLTLIGSYGIQDYAELHRLSYFLVRMPWLSNITWKMMGGSRWAVRYTLKSILNNPQSRTEAILDEVMYAIENTDSQQAFGEWQLDEMLWDGLRTNYTDKLHEITVPVLLVHGTQDAGVPLRYAERAATKFPNVRFEIINNAGHWTHRDYPDQFNALLLEHLQAAVT